MDSRYTTSIYPHGLCRCYYRDMASLAPSSMPMEHRRSARMSRTQHRTTSTSTATSTLYSTSSISPSTQHTQKNPPFSYDSWTTHHKVGGNTSRSTSIPGVKSTWAVLGQVRHKEEPIKCEKRSFFPYMVTGSFIPVKRSYFLLFDKRLRILPPVFAPNVAVFGSSIPL